MIRLQIIMEWLNRQKQSRLIAYGLTVIVCIGLANLIAGYEVSFFIFYLLPVSVVTLAVGMRAGFLLSLVSAAVWYGADTLSGHVYPNPLIPYWNAGMRFIFFIVVVVLQDAFAREWNIARTDFLTGLANRKLFFEAAELEIERARRYGHPFSLAYIDLDNFKTMNDRYGHKTGDKLLKAVGYLLKRNIRRIDSAARLGGDEFAVLMPQTAAEPVLSIFRKIQALLLQNMKQNGWPVTFSIGIVTFETPPKDVDQLVNVADDLMYAAKREGKNRISHQVR